MPLSDTLNPSPELQETEDFMEEHEEKMKELIQDDLAMEALDLLFREQVTELIQNIANRYGLEAEVTTQNDE